MPQKQKQQNSTPYVAIASTDQASNDNTTNSYNDNMASLLLKYRPQRESTKIFVDDKDNKLQRHLLPRWNSCGGQDTDLLKMCSPPSWKSSEGEDVEGDYSVWSSNKEDNEDSDWSPEADGEWHGDLFRVHSYRIFRSDFLSYHTFLLSSWGV